MSLTNFQHTAPTETYEYKGVHIYRYELKKGEIYLVPSDYVPDHKVKLSFFDKLLNHDVENKVNDVLADIRRDIDDLIIKRNSTQYQGDDSNQ